MIRTRACAYQGVRNVPFPENLACFVFLSHPFWESPFFLITGDIYFLGFAEKERRLSGFRFLKKSLIHYKSVYPKCHFVFLINRNVKSEIKFWFSFLYWSWDRKYQNKWFSDFQNSWTLKFKFEVCFSFSILIWKTKNKIYLNKYYMKLVTIPLMQS